MNKFGWTLALTLLLAGCEPSFKEEYQATLKELETTKAALAVAEERLKAADNEIRHNIFSLMRRASNHLRSQEIEPNKLNQYAQELSVHIDSYQQLNSTDDHVSITAVFYANKLDQISDLREQTSQVYDRRFTECLRGIGTQQNKHELSNMLCEVQADVAKEDLESQLHASVKALLTITEAQLEAGRRSTSSAITANELEKRFKSLVAENKEKTS